jgi:histidyl-tRNA synthetase
MKPTYRALRGTRDILPGESEKWQLVERTARDVFSRYGFSEIRTPIFEATELFARSVGASTDIVRKEMYTFQAGDESVTLRPECTAPVVRAFVEHALYRTVSAGFPERYFYIGPMFRYERPQKGRQRQFHQIGAEVLGASEPLADAETLDMVWAFLTTLGVRDCELVLNSVGDASCRPRFREALVEWLRPVASRLCPDCQRRVAENPLRVFDCKIAEDVHLLREAPTMVEHLCGACVEHFDAVQDVLRGYGIPFRVDPRIVRGLDYYERTVFEVVSGGLGSQNAVLGGGRYDGLVHEIGGPSVPGFGFALGIERLVLLLPDAEVPQHRTDLLLVTLGAAGWQAGINLAKRLRESGLRVAMPMSERPMGAQLKRAERLGARFALFVGEEEVRSGRFGLKNLSTGEQVSASEQEVTSLLGGRNEP